MYGQIGGGNSESDVIPFARVEKNTTDGGDQLDTAGRTILQLVQRAAGVADENSRHALGMAQKLSDQLRAAEDRIAELETEVTAYQQRANRPSSGSIASTPKLKIDFFRRAIVRAR
jgi:hypothetical protein